RNPIRQDHDLSNRPVCGREASAKLVCLRAHISKLSSGSAGHNCKAAGAALQQRFTAVETKAAGRVVPGCVAGQTALRKKGLKEFDAVTFSSSPTHSACSQSKERWPIQQQSSDRTHLHPLIVSVFEPRAYYPMTMPTSVWHRFHPGLLDGRRRPHE